MTLIVINPDTKSIYNCKYATVCLWDQNTVTFDASKSYLEKFTETITSSLNVEKKLYFRVLNTFRIKAKTVGFNNSLQSNKFPELFWVNL